MKAKVTLEVYCASPERRGGWRWRIKRGNGKVLDGSTEGFGTRAGAKLNLRRTRDALNALTETQINQAGK